jgi:creatinine amidohydrolase
MKTIAARLNAKWADRETRVHFIPEYYDNSVVASWLEKNGIREQNEGLHDDFAITAQLMAVDPTTVRMKQRIAVGKFHINGITLSATETAAWGKRIIALRAETTVRAIRKAIQGEGKG